MPTVRCRRLISFTVSMLHIYSTLLFSLDLVCGVVWCVCGVVCVCVLGGGGGGGGEGRRSYILCLFPEIS